DRWSYPVAMSVLDGLKSSTEQITINKDYELGYEVFPYAYLEVDSAFSFDQLDHLQCSYQMDQVGLSGCLFRRCSLQSSYSSQTRWRERAKPPYATDSRAGKSQST